MCFIGHQVNSEIEETEVTVPYITDQLTSRFQEIENRLRINCVLDSFMYHLLFTVTYTGCSRIRG